MASGSVNEVPTVDALLKSGAVMRYVLMRIIRNRALTGGAAASDAQTKADFARIAQLADDGLAMPLDGRARLLYDALEQEMARVTDVLGRIPDGARAMI